MELAIPYRLPDRQRMRLRHVARSQGDAREEPQQGWRGASDGPRVPLSWRPQAQRGAGLLPADLQAPPPDEPLKPGRRLGRPIRSRTWGANVRGGSHPRTQWMGRGGRPEGSHTAVAKTRSTNRSTAPDQPRPVAVCPPVAGLAKTAATVGSRWPCTRGRPVCRGFRDRVGSYRAASSRTRVMLERGGAT